MGSWGAGLFSDDIARDVRDAYVDLVGDGHAGPEATETLLREWDSQLDDPDVGPVVWLALAATQWRYGRLEDRVKLEALEIIQSGSDLRRWADDPQLLRRRRSVLEKLSQQLNAAQPPPKRIRKRFRDDTAWAVGEVIAYRLTSGSITLFRVIGFHEDRGGKGPIVELLDWVGRQVPERSLIARLPVKALSRPLHAGQRNQFLIGRLAEAELPEERVVRTGITLQPSQPSGGFAVYLWRHLDAQLEAFYGIS